MPDTAIDLCNRALVRCGAEQIADFETGRLEAQVCKVEYEALVREALTVPGGRPYRWRFASRQAQLVRLTALPPGRWRFAYQAPQDCLAVHAVTQRGAVVEYERFGDRIVTDADDGQGAILVMDYTWRVPEGMWPPAFASGLVRDLTMRLALALNRDIDLTRAVGGLFDWSAALTADSQQQTSHHLRAGRLLAARGVGTRGRGSYAGPPQTPPPEPPRTDPTFIADVSYPAP